jgi:hypothetical protein
MSQEALRDTLGLLRLLYTAAREQGAEPAELQALEAAGARLRTALDLNQREPGTLGHRAAPSHAEAALAGIDAAATAQGAGRLLEAARRRLGLAPKAASAEPPGAPAPAGA